jgi:hypothetical protein
MKRQYAIGESFEYLGMNLICKEDRTKRGCNECALSDDSQDCHGMYTSCSSNFRSDNTNVHFEKTEEDGKDEI